MKFIFFSIQCGECEETKTDALTFPPDSAQPSSDQIGDLHQKMVENLSEKPCPSCGTSGNFELATIEVEKLTN